MLKTENVLLVVDLPSVGKRLDRFLAARAPSRAQVQRDIAAGRVLVDGQVAQADSRLREGQRIEWASRAYEAAPADLLPEQRELDILFEDEHVVVLNKPAGLVVHPAAGHASGTLANALVGRSLGGVDATRPGIVHRLDKGTSGIIVVAKSLLAYANLGAQFRVHSVERRYLAIVVGRPPARGEMRTLYGRHPTQRKKFSSRVRSGKAAVTLFRALQALRGATLVEATLETGRTHQVRVHFSDAGFPILGDPTYGRPPKDEQLRAVAQQLGRPALHATVLGFDHPATLERLRFEAAPPEDFAAALATLR